MTDTKRTATESCVTSHEPITASDSRKRRLASPPPHLVSRPSSSADSSVVVADTTITVSDNNSTTGRVTAAAGSLQSVYEMNLAAETVTAADVVVSRTDAETASENEVRLKNVDQGEVRLSNLAVGKSNMSADMSTLSVADMSYDSDTDCQLGVNGTFTVASSPVVSLTGLRTLPVNVSDSPSATSTGTGCLLIRSHIFEVPQKIFARFHILEKKANSENILGKILGKYLVKH